MFAHDASSYNRVSRCLTMRNIFSWFTSTASVQLVPTPRLDLLGHGCAKEESLPLAWRGLRGGWVGGGWGLGTVDSFAKQVN